MDIGLSKELRPDLDSLGAYPRMDAQHESQLAFESVHPNATATDNSRLS